MWTPKTSNKSNSNCAYINGRTHMTPYSTPFVSSSAVSNESGGNNKGLHNNLHGRFTPYLSGSFASRSSTNIVGYPSGVQQTQLSLGSSHGHWDITKIGGPPLIPNKPHLVPNKGHVGRIVNSIGGFVSADGSSSSSTGLTNVPNPASGFNLSVPSMFPIPANSHIGAPMQLSQNQYQDETGHFSYMRLLNDSNDDDVNVGVNDLRHLPGYYSSVGDTQGQLGGLNIGGFVDYGATTQRQKEHLEQPQQYPMGRSPGFMFGAINASHHPLQQDHDSSVNGIGFSFPTPGNQDLHFHGSGSSLQQYQHFQKSQPSFYNPLRGKEVKPAQGSLLGPDDYGLLGLLKIIKGVNRAKTSLAMGVDPHSLGLELNSLEPLHPKFASPWSDEPVKEGPKYDIPQCYNSKQPPALKRCHFKKFHLTMLFYIFYSMPQDQAQLFAANELHDRGWYFHRKLRMWFTRDKNTLSGVKNATYEVGCYIYFDPRTWQTISQDNFVLHYEMIEQRPGVG